jgi:hypothetical protein
MEMKLQIIETPDYILAFSDEEIKENDIVWNQNTNSIAIYTGHGSMEWWKKIIAYQSKKNAFELLPIVKYGNMTFKELNGDGSYYECIDCEVQTLRSSEFLKSQGVELYKNKHELDLPLLPEISVEEDVEKLAKIATSKLVYSGPTASRSAECFIWIKGYKAATKVYSEKDLRKAIQYAYNKGVLEIDISIDDIIQSLKQPKWFVAEMEEESGFTSNGYYSKIVLKTTTINGKTYLVGTYLYE